MGQTRDLEFPAGLAPDRRETKPFRLHAPVPSARRLDHNRGWIRYSRIEVVA